MKKDKLYKLRTGETLAVPPQRVLLDQLSKVLEMIAAAEQPLEPRSAPLLSIDMNISRYEVALSRQLYKTIGELERLQRIRKGDYVPPPIKVGITET
jgi:hypothetical protein